MEENIHTFEKTKRDTHIIRPYENLIFLVFKDFIYELIHRFYNLVLEFKYTGKMVFPIPNEDDSEDGVVKINTIEKNVTNFCFGEESTVKVLNANGVITTVQTKVLNGRNVIGGGLFFMLDDIFKNMNLNNFQRLHCTSGFTSDIDFECFVFNHSFDEKKDYDVYLEDYGDDELIADNNPEFMQFFKNFVINGCEEFILSKKEDISNKINFLKNFVNIQRYALELDNDSTNISKKINFNVHFKIPGNDQEEHIQHLTDMFLIFSNSPPTPINLFEIKKGMYLPSGSNSLILHLINSFDRIMSAHDETLIQFPGSREIVYTKCYNDFQRFKWLIDTIKNNQYLDDIFKIDFKFYLHFNNAFAPYIASLPNSMSKFVETVVVGNPNTPDDEIFDKIKNMGRVILSDDKNHKFIIKNTDSDDFTVKAKHYAGRVEYSYAVTRKLFYSFLPYYYIVLGLNSISDKNLKNVSNFYNILLEVQGRFPESECLYEENVNERNKIIAIYEHIISLSDKQKQQIVENHYGKRGWKINIDYGFGRIFKKLLMK
jgi:hypothetical protein